MNDLGRAERNLKMVPEDQPIIHELRAVSDLLHEANNERNSPGNWALSFKEGTRIVAETAYKRLFVHIKGIQPGKAWPSPAPILTASIRHRRQRGCQ